MPAPKSLILPMSIDRALKSHTCQHNRRHGIAKGDLRLKIAVGRSYEHYCTDCAQKFIGLAIENLQKLSAELQE
jgi:hypothetical protein